MKILFFFLASLIAFVSYSCADTVTHNVFSDEKPKICIDVFDKPPSIYVDQNKLNDYSVEDLITLNKCGKEYSPQISLNSEIINQPNYPVPILLDQLKKEESDEFRYYIIDVLCDTPELKLNSYKYENQFRNDDEKITDEISDAISKMRDEKYKKLSERKLTLLKTYFQKNID